MEKSRGREARTIDSHHEARRRLIRTDGGRCTPGWWSEYQRWARCSLTGSCSHPSFSRATTTPLPLLPPKGGIPFLQSRFRSAERSWNFLLPLPALQPPRLQSHDLNGYSPHRAVDCDAFRISDDLRGNLPQGSDASFCSCSCAIHSEALKDARCLREVGGEVARRREPSLGSSLKRAFSSVIIVISSVGRNVHSQSKSSAARRWRP